MYQLGRYSLWFDEVKLLSREDNINTIFKKAGTFYNTEDRYPCFLSKLFFYYWQRLGKSEFILRIPAVAFGVLTILTIYQLGKSLSGNRTGLFAAFILSISPLHLYYSREAMMYSMVVLTVLLSVYFLIKALRDNRLRFWFGYLAFNLMSIYTHYMTIFILLAEIIFFLVYCIRYRNLFKKWLLVHILIFLFLTPWLINVISLLRLVFTGGEKYFWLPDWAKQVSFRNIFYTLKNFSAGYNVTTIIYIPIIIIFFLLLTLGLIKKQKTEITTLFLLCFLIPILSMYLISKIKVWYVDRYVLPSAIFYYLLVANGLSKLRNRYAIPILCSIVILNGFGIKNYYKDIFPDYKSCAGVLAKKDYRGASKYIMDNFQDGDVIFHTSSSSSLPFEYYFGIIDKDKAEKLIAKSAVLRLAMERRKAIPWEFKEQGVRFIKSDISIENQKRVWLVYSSFNFHIAINFKNNPDELCMRNYIENFYIKKDVKEFREIIVYLYERN